MNRIAFCPPFLPSNGFATNHLLKDFRRLLKDTGFKIESPEAISYSKPFSIAQYYSRFLKSFNKAAIFITIYPTYCNSILPGGSLFLWDAILIRYLTMVHPGCKSILYIIDLPIDQAKSYGKDINEAAYPIEGDLFKCYDILCVFNKGMKKRIQELYDIPNDRFIEFEMLDYGLDFQPQKTRMVLDGTWNIVCTGNMAQKYAGRWPLDLVLKEGITYEFFGNDGSWIMSPGRSDLIYKGSLPPSELAEYISSNAHFGIIYYDRKNVSEYLEYTATSKFSGYLAAGVPIITCKSHQYISGLVEKYDVGVSFETVKDIPNILGHLSTDRYLELRKNSQILGEKIRDGFFLKRAIKDSLDLVSPEEI